jgi:viroplasmin and RNaseH domain-containing protein
MKQWYVVRRGELQEYNSWGQCEDEVTCYNNNMFKGFKSRHEAKKYYLEYLKHGERNSQEVHNASQIGMSNYKVRNNATHMGSSKVKDFIILIKFIVIVFLWLLIYVRGYL